MNTSAITFPTFAEANAYQAKKLHGKAKQTGKVDPSGIPSYRIGSVCISNICCNRLGAPFCRMEFTITHGQFWYASKGEVYTGIRAAIKVDGEENRFEKWEVVEFHDKTEIIGTLSATGRKVFAEMIRSFDNPDHEIDNMALLIAASR